MSGGQPRPTLGERFYRLALRVYPAAFRRRYETDLLRFYRDRRAELAAGGGVAGLRLLAHVVRDLMRSLPRELLASRRSASRRARPRLLRSFLADLRHAVRTLARRPGFSTAVVTTLALGIGANTAVFSLVNGMLLAPLPYPEAERLVGLRQSNAAGNRWNLSVADFQGIEARQRSFEAVTAMRFGTRVLSAGERPTWVNTVAATAGLLDTFGVDPVEGRGFLPGEDRPDVEPVALVGHAFRERHFGAGEAVGGTLVLDDVPHTVVGVLPPGVDDLGGMRAEVWPILQLQEPRRRGPFFLTVIGRIADGASIDGARSDLDAISEALFPLWAAGFQDETARLIPVPLRDAIVGNVGRSLWVVFGAVSFLLLVAVANVSNLILTRAAGRQRETAVRRALGAGGGRLASWLLAEGLILATVGAAFGLGLAWLGVRLLRSGATGLPRLNSVGIDVDTLVFAAGLVGITALTSALVPLALAAGRDVAGTLKQSSAGGGVGPRAQMFRSGLVVLEFGLTLPLVAAATLLASSLVHLQRVDPGYDPAGVLAVQLTLPRAAYPEYDDVVVFWNEAVAAVRDLANVENAGATTGLPPNAPTWSNNFNLLDRPVEPGQPEPVSPWVVTTPGYLETLGIPLLEGRLFDAGDVTAAAPVVVVSRSWVDRYYPGESALGREMVNGGCTQCTPTVVIGVVGDVKYQGLAGSGEAVYEPGPTMLLRSLSIVARTRGGEREAVDAIAAALRRLDPELPLASVHTLQDQLHASIARPRQWTALFVLFATIGLVLSAVGIYGVLSYFVRRQRQEIGVRVALGAEPRRVVALVLRRGMARAGAGILVGLLAAIALSRWLEAFLFGVQPTDPAVLAGVSLLLLAVAFAACLIPGRRAARVDPVRAIVVD